MAIFPYEKVQNLTITVLLFPPKAFFSSLVRTESRNGTAEEQKKKKKKALITSTVAITYSFIHYAQAKSELTPI